MTAHDRRLLRIATAIEERSQADHTQPHRSNLPGETLSHVAALHCQRERAHQHGWQLAVSLLDRQLRSALQYLQSELATMQQELRPHEPVPGQSVGELFADLRALHDEFPQVAIDQRGQTINVTTEPIVLEGVALGPFEIILDLRDLHDGCSQCYRINAVSPQPAVCNDSVTHPHVQDETLCEGDGRLPIERALRQRRLLDFFVIVRGILETYNPESPYVAVADWFGTECSDCGTLIDTDEGSSCEDCGNTLCEECYLSCPDCSCVSCAQCTRRCDVCDESHCPTCLTPCIDCAEPVCPDCRDSERRCDNCHDTPTEEPPDETTQEAAESSVVPSADTAVHTAGVGQAVVPA